MNVGIFLSSKQRSFFTLTALLAVSFISSLFLGNTAHAAIAIDQSVKENAQSYTSYVALSGCAQYRLKNEIETDPADSKVTDPSTWYGSGPLFDEGDAYVYPSGAKRDCGEVFKSAATLWGITDYGKFLENVGYTFDVTVPSYKWSGSTDERKTAFVNEMKKYSVNGVRADQLNDVTKYAIYVSSLEGDCKGVDVGAYTSTYKSYADTGKRDGDYVYAKVVTPSGDRVFKRLYGKDFIVYGYILRVATTAGSVRDADCGTINDTVNATASAYALTDAKIRCQTSGPKYTEASLINACANGALHKSSSVTYCFDTYKGVYSAGSGSSQKAERDACFVGQGNSGGGQCIDVGGYTNSDTLQACINGTKNNNDANYCNATYPAPDSLSIGNPTAPTDTNATKRQACKDGQGFGVLAAIDEPQSTQDGEDPDATTSCVVEGIGWIVCPTITFLSGIADGAFAVIQNFLKVNVAVYSSDSGTFVAWSAFRSIANALFVIVFLIIIFSQLTGQGVSNYGVKKTLPRLIITVILVNISFYVCQIIVDVTQILGGSVVELLSNIPVGSTANAGPGSWTDVMGDILMGTGIIAGLAVAGVASFTIVALSISGPVLLAFLLAVLMTVVILIGRQAAIVILIILAPIALVAYLLPNTEQWFKRWIKMFWGLLLVYPIVALLYGGGDLAARIIANVANTSSGLDAQTKFWFGIIAIGVSAIPLIMTPFILKGALNATGTLGAKLSGFASKANGGVRRAANSSSRYGEAKQGIKNRFALGRATRRARSPMQQAIDRSSVGRALGLDKGAARAVNVLAREDEESVEAEVAQIKSITNSTNRIPEAKNILKEAIKAGDVTRARAAQRILLGSGNKGIDTIQDVYSAQGKDSDMQGVFTQSEASKKAMEELRTDLNSAGLKGKNNALATFGYENIGPDKFTERLTHAETYSKLNPVELAGQSYRNLKLNQARIDHTMAASVLANPEAAALLDQEKRKVFEEIVQNAPAQTTQQTPAAQPQGQPQAPGTAAQRARDTAARAAQGTQGDGVFVVGHGGGSTTERQDPPQTPPNTPPSA